MTLKIIVAVIVITIIWVALVLMPIVSEREEMERQGADVDRVVFFWGATVIAACPAMVTAAYFLARTRIKHRLWLVLICAAVSAAVFLGGTFLAASAVTLPH